MMASDGKTRATRKSVDERSDEDIIVTYDSHEKGRLIDLDPTLVIDVYSKSVDNTDETVKAKSKGKRRSGRGGNRGGGDRNVVANRSFRLYSRNSRRSRNGFGRGLPKKGGAGGKGTWGVPGSELMVEEYVADVKDPNYDNENQDDCKFQAIAPELTREDLLEVFDPLIQEYYQHGYTEEVIDGLEGLNLEKWRPEIVYLAINRSLECKPSKRELTSVLLSDMFGKIVLREDFVNGFDLLLDNLPDLILDTPKADILAGNFIARAVADDCLPPKFVQSRKNKVECEHARVALERADALLRMKHGLVRLSKVWGNGGAERPVKSLTNQMQLILKEFLSSGDVLEAIECLQELEVPHFHHEFVYIALIMVIEDMREVSISYICNLFEEAGRTFVITMTEMSKGFYRVYDEMPDIVIDVPQAYTILEKIVKRCEPRRFLLLDVIDTLPTRCTLYEGCMRSRCEYEKKGRKRFVSEGDGGAVKCTIANP